MTIQEIERAFLTGIRVDGSFVGWVSYRIPLLVALQNSTGKIIEMGAGLGSTELLRAYALASGREFETYETDAEWAAKTGATHILDWDVVSVSCGLLFVDHAPGERRKVDLARAASLATVVVAHDTEPAADHGYGMRDVIKAKYLYAYDFNIQGAWATVMSNFVDVRAWATRIEELRDL